MKNLRSAFAITCLINCLLSFFLPPFIAALGWIAASILCFFDIRELLEDDLEDKEVS